MCVDGQTIDDPVGKNETLIRSFFPPPVEADLDDLDNFTYPASIRLGLITIHEIIAAIKQAPSHKAPGYDGIPNSILKIALSIIKFPLLNIFNSSLQMGYYPAHFRNSVTVALRKPTKEDYSSPKSYRPIALLNTMGKAMEFIVAKRIQATAEAYFLLPDTHMGGRKLRSSEHGIHYVLECVFGAWSKNKVVSMLLLDVAGAYDKVSHKRLLHDLQRKGIDDVIIRWVANFLSERTTILKTNEHTSEITNISVGIPQGSPLSPILYLFYNSEIFEKIAKRRHQGVDSTGFVDDVGLLAVSHSTEENCRKLATIHEEVCSPWAKKHGSEFAPAKYQLIHLTNKRLDKDALEASVKLPQYEIKPKDVAKYLGLIFDTRLTWKPHIESIKSKVTKSVGALYKITGSTWGGSYTAIRKIYKATVLPQITYCCSVWYPQFLDRKKGYLVKMLESVQAKAAMVITGADKGTSFPALNIEAFLVPIDQVLEQLALNTMVRIHSTPAYKDIARIRLALSPRSKKAACRKRPPLELLEDIYIRRHGSLFNL